MTPPRPRLLLVALALIPAMHLVVLVPELWRTADEPRDFLAYTLAAERVRAGEPLYEPVPPGPHVPGEGKPYLYPPFLAAITALVPLSGIALSRFALLAGVLCFWIYAACLARVAAGRVTTYGFLLWGALLTAGIFPLSTLLSYRGPLHLRPGFLPLQLAHLGWLGVRWTRAAGVGACLPDRHRNRRAEFLPCG